MLDETKNIKDSTQASQIAIKDGQNSLSYNKTNKLISALYMVTDMLDEGEPIRLKLRTLGADIISDIYILTSLSHPKVRPVNTERKDGVEIKIIQILSFLEVSSSINLISEMNYNILKKEFIELGQSIQEFLKQSTGNEPITLAEFFKDEDKGHVEIAPGITFYKGHPIVDKGHERTRIGVQKGSTLLKAITNVSNRSVTPNLKNNFDILKQDRRQEIISIVRASPKTEGVTITDIKNRAKGPLVSCGEKTLQRELISMLKDNILTKTGSKRWSRYYLPS
ncbi:hypothetical protein K2P96_01045 [Patescibacteria group bacterium]|nr:hypothetical protein [Patescibacteria group bacterium]